MQSVFIKLLHVLQPTDNNIDGRALLRLNPSSLSKLLSACLLSFGKKTTCNLMSLAEECIEIPANGLGLQILANTSLISSKHEVNLMLGVYTMNLSQLI